MKEDLEDTSDSYDKVMKKNKKLHEEINDLQHTVQESSRNIHELEKEKRSGGFSKAGFFQPMRVQDLSISLKAILSRSRTC